MERKYLPKAGGQPLLHRAALVSRKARPRLGESSRGRGAAVLEDQRHSAVYLHHQRFWL